MLFDGLNIRVTQANTFNLLISIEMLEKLLMAKKFWMLTKVNNIIMCLKEPIQWETDEIENCLKQSKQN